MNLENWNFVPVPAGGQLFKCLIPPRGRITQKWCILWAQNGFAGLLLTCTYSGTFRNPQPLLFSESGRGGWKTQGGGKTYRKFGEKPLPKNVFGPPTYDTFSPPPFFGDSLSFPLKERGTDQTNPNFWGLQKWFWRAHSAVRFPPPQIHAIRFAPPLSRCPIFSQKQHFIAGTNGRRIAVQIGGVVCRFPFFKAWKLARHSVTNGGGVLRYKLEVHCQYFSDKLYGLGVPEQCPCIAIQTAC